VEDAIGFPHFCSRLRIVLELISTQVLFHEQESYMQSEKWYKFKDHWWWSWAVY